MPIARPTSTPAAYATNGGSRTEPGSGEKATGRAPGARIPARIFNWLVGVPLEWVAWLAALIGADEELTYQTPKTAQLIWAPMHLFKAEYKAGGADVRFITDPVGGGHIKITGAEDGWYTSAPLNEQLRTGMTITGLICEAKPGFARGIGTPANQMQVELMRQPRSPLLPVASPGGCVQIAAAVDDGTNTVQRITPAAFTHVVSKAASEYFVRVRFGNDAATHNDELYDVYVVVTSIGPRSI